MTNEKPKAIPAAFLFLLLVPVVLRVVSPLVFKLAALSMEAFTLWNIVTNALYWLSLLVFGLRAVSWQYALKHVPLSLAYPINSLSLVLLLAVGYFYFGESVNLWHILGTIFIVSGSVLIATDSIA